MGKTTRKADIEKEKVGEKFGEKFGEEFGENQKSIIRLMINNPYVPIPEIARSIGVSTTAVEKNEFGQKTKFLKISEI